MAPQICEATRKDEAAVGQRDACQHGAIAALLVLNAGPMSHASVLLAEQVHVLDVCQALWHVTTAGDDGEIYNLVDKNDTSRCSMPCPRFRSPWTCN